MVCLASVPGLRFSNVCHLCIIKMRTEGGGFAYIVLRLRLLALFTLPICGGRIRDQSPFVSNSALLPCQLSCLAATNRIFLISHPVS